MHVWKTHLANRCYVWYTRSWKLKLNLRLIQCDESRCLLWAQNCVVSSQMYTKVWMYKFMYVCVCVKLLLDVCVCVCDGKYKIIRQPFSQLRPGRVCRLHQRGSFVLSPARRRTFSFPLFKLLILITFYSSEMLQISSEFSDEHSWRLQFARPLGCIECGIPFTLFLSLSSFAPSLRCVSVPDRRVF